MIAASRDLVSQGSGAFIEAVNEYVAEPPGAESLEPLFELIANDKFWPLETGISPESVEAMANAAIRAGALEEVPAFEDVVDTRPFEMAMEMVGGN
jgi:hypothetical protein